MHNHFNLTKRWSPKTICHGPSTPFCLNYLKINSTNKNDEKISGEAEFIFPRGKNASIILNTWEHLPYIAGWEKWLLTSCGWLVALHFFSCKQPANGCWLFDTMKTCQRVQVNGHFSARVAHLSATCTPPQVYGHFSDFFPSVKICLQTTCQPRQVVGRFSDPCQQPASHSWLTAGFRTW